MSAPRPWLTPPPFPLASLRRWLVVLTLVTPVGACSDGSVTGIEPNSEVASLPVMIRPAARRREVLSSSRGAIK